MGMSASQARFLGLTARKSNTEYQGQQINQQRTTLSNQSANLYNQMLSMVVPAPPDVTNYYNDVYTFQSGDTTYQIVSGLGSQGAQSSAIVQQSSNSYFIGVQPFNSGLAAQIALQGQILTINGNQLYQLSQQSSRAQIRDILDNGSSGGQPNFVYTAPPYSSYSAVSDDNTLNDPVATKYTNQLNQVNDPTAINNDFMTNFNNNIPTYYATTAGNGVTTYTQVTKDNFNDVMQMVQQDKSVKVYQEARDSQNNPIKQALTQNQVANTKGLTFYVNDNAQIVTSYAAAQPGDTGQKYVGAFGTSKAALPLDDPDFQQEVTDGDIVLYKAVQNADGSTGCAKINSLDELNALDDNEGVYIVGFPDDPAYADYMVAIPLSDAQLSDPAIKALAPTQYIEQREEETPDATTPVSQEITQDEWNQLKAAGDTDKMDYIIANLDYDNPDYAAINTLSYYTANNVTRYVQDSYLGLDDGQSYKTVQIPQEFYESSYTNYTNQVFTNLVWTQDSGSGRYTSMSATAPDGTQRTYTLAFSRVQDDDAYNQAMMDYNYKKDQYDKAVADINSKTAIIQNQDKNLELQLKQLDTEREALQNEIDAVKKVIKDNVDSTFKTFGNG